MKKPFLISISGALVAGVVSANAGFAADMLFSNINTTAPLKNESNTTSKLKETETKSKNLSEPKIDASSKEQKAKKANESSYTISGKEDTNTNSRKNSSEIDVLAAVKEQNSKKADENSGNTSKKENINDNATKISEGDDNNKPKEGFFSKFKSLKSLTSGLAGLLAYAGFAATSTALTAETVGLSKIGTKLGIQKDTANYITVGTGVAAAVLATAEFLIKG